MVPISPLARLLYRLGPLDTEDRIDAILGEINATCAGQIELLARPAWIELHGVSAKGPDLYTLCARWIAAAVDAAPLAEARARLALTG